MKIDATVTVLDKDLGYSDLKRTLERAGRVSSVAGLVRGKTPKEVIEYGAKNHFGSPAEGIPARPFVTQTWDAGGEALYEAFLVDELDRWLLDRGQGRNELNEIFGRAADLAAEGIVQAIDGGDFADNAPQTVEEKGGSKPLVDSGRLRGSIEWDVRAKGEEFREPASLGRVANFAAGKALASKGKQTRKRKRKVSLRRRAGGLGSLAKGQGYQGKGIRKRAESRSGRAASGVASKGVRRKRSSLF